MTKLIPLSCLHPGQASIVQKFTPNLAPHYRKLLQQLGIRRSATIRLIRRAPLGDPLQLQILGSQFSLRSSEACHIYVEILSHQPHYEKK